MSADTHTTHRPHHLINPHGAFDGRSSRLYDLVARRLQRGMYRRMAEDVTLVAPPDGAVLDIGTGPGVLLTEIARGRPDLHVTGVDLSQDMVAVAARNLRPYTGRAEVLAGDVADLPLPDDAFDLVVASLSMHHWADVPAAFAEIARVLRPGGRVHVYDLPRAPFAAADAAALAAAGLADHPVRTDMRTGRPHLRRLVRLVLTAEAAAA